VACVGLHIRYAHFSRILDLGRDSLSNLIAHVADADPVRLQIPFSRTFMRVEDEGLQKRAAVFIFLLRFFCTLIIDIK
jgi:hypothetical protein